MNVRKVKSPIFVLNANDKCRDNVKANLINFLSSLPVDKGWKIEIRQLRKDRTLLQNRALFGVAYGDLMPQTGYTKDELHEHFCGEFFGWTERKVFGRVKRVPVRTTTTDENGHHDLIDTKTLAAMYELIQIKAAEMGMFVSDPDPTWFMKEREAMAA